MDPAARMQYCMEPLRKPITRHILASLHLPIGIWVLDAGCGIGLQAIQLAQAVGPTGHVTGLDASASLLHTARQITRQAGLAEHVSYELGNWNQIPHDAKTFDLVWSMDAAGYAPHEPLATVRELVRVIKPGGRLVLGYWSSQCLLPGYPALEARLSASSAGIAPFSVNSRPEAHFLNTTGWVREAGLEDTRAETFVNTVMAPLHPDERDALAVLLQMRWGTAEPDVNLTDWRDYLRLCLSDSPDFILNSLTYCAFFTYSVFTGVVPG